jgi:putative inorganic carbon (HCO3(-)) transporter
LASEVVALIAIRKKRVKTLIAIAVIVYAGYILLPAEQKIRFESMGDDKTSIQRLNYWKHGWEMMKDHPLLGVGYFNFLPYYDLHYRNDMILRKAQLPHNIFIQVGTDTGFIGLAVFFAIIFTGFFSMRRIGKEAKICGDGFVSELSTGMNIALIGYIVAGQFVTVAYYPYLWIHLMFVTAMYTFWHDECNSNQNSTSLNLLQIYNKDGGLSKL